MKLEKWALMAEIVGGVAIVISLMILVIEVRGNTAAVQAQTAATLLESERARRYPLIVNEGQLAELIIKQANREPLSDVERFQLARYHNEELTNYAWQFKEVQDGRLPEDRLNIPLWREFSERLSETFEDSRDVLDPEFIQFWEENVINR